MKRFISMSVFLLLATLCFSASLTVLVNQRDSGGTIIFENTRIFEDGLINYFFETGNIVSNEPVCLDLEYKGAFQAALDASKIGYIDYIAVFTISIDSLTQEISHVDWGVYDVTSGAEIDQGMITAPSIADKIDIEKGILKFAEQNGALVSKAIAKVR